ncbi:MAG: bifunctional riboflavin kinase/FAD synthetase [Bryobacteraceae bacterium]
MTAVAIGVFDGVHVGHQALLRRTKETARELGLRSAVLTFHPHPACVVAPDRAPRLLYSIDERRELLLAQGVDEVHVLPFDQALVEMSAEDFAEGTLRSKLQAKAVLVGEDFRFGYQRKGDVGTLARLGFQTRPLAPVMLRGVVVSSTEVRKRIQSGDVLMAGRLLGRPYGISGEVVRGHGIGSKQTVPTLNLSTTAEVIPANGVYITHTTDLATGAGWNSITNVGTRPTFENAGGLSIETFLLDTLTGSAPERIRVDFLRHVRDEKKFESPEALRARILRDVAIAKTYFRRLNW